MSIRKIIKDTWIIAYMKSIPDIKRQPLMLLILVGLAAIPLFFITLFGGAEMMDVGLVGVIVSSIGFIAITASIQDITWDRYVKLREMVVAMPVHPLSYAMGLTLGFLIFSFPGFIAFLCYGVYRGLFDPFSILVTLGAMILCWLALAAMGFTIATYQHKTSPNTLGIIANILSFGFVFLPPVYYSEAMLTNMSGMNLSWIVYIFPTSNAAAIIRYATGAGETVMDPTAFMLHWLVLIVTVVVFSALVMWKARWREP
ncbi:MAG: ABC transporter permease [Candidatus Thermoplasmatota archaeon]|nr:ABC transporter permease [Euryarchaeota archaeon]MBU4033101.1 ABC transporter permease [Candidatus Thermoplasmatota archaeon]MBU4072340.1 ABC transporter permease [Candidatus Thermoplasmatota archaeon]MBU4143628.1 ABC transporter permease [Candidatus Thermoplasmatota archaeon]MBU4591288.1 ABC transporter permease [Candidatus Thermoplasmatota archaeon]